MVIPYRTAKFKSANTFVIAVWNPTAKFNSRQYFWLYGIYQQERGNNGERERERVIWRRWWGRGSRVARLLRVQQWCNGLCDKVHKNA